MKTNTINKESTIVKEMLNKKNMSSIAKTFRLLYKERNTLVPKTMLTHLITTDWLPYPYLDWATVNARKKDLRLRYWFEIITVQMKVKAWWRNVPKYTFLMLVDWLTQIQIERKIKRLRNKYEIK